VIHSYADGRIEDTGPLTKKRMETIDDDVTNRTIAFIEQAVKNEQPFFVWWNSTHMHFRTHIPESAEGLSGQGFYNDAMVLHDQAVGRLLDALDELDIAEDTIVLYSTDNGPHYNTWPDGAITPWRSEKNSNWEGAYRVPSFARWPGKFEAGRIVNDIFSHQDWLPTLMAAAGEPDIKQKLLDGHQAGEKTFKVFIDGVNGLPWLLGEEAQSPRNFFAYVNDDGALVALRAGDWKVVFQEQRAKTMQLWAEPFVELRVPKIFHLRRDPFERADENSNSYWDWHLDHVWALYPAQNIVAQQIQSFIEFPPRQEPASFNLDTVLEQLQDASGGGMH
jgi:arylsulfatase